MSLSEDAIIIKEEYHCHPFFDFMMKSRACNEAGFDGRAKKTVLSTKPQSDDLKQEFNCMKFKYKSVPQYLDLGLMTKNFIQTLIKGEKLLEFNKFCNKNLEEAKE